MKASDEEKNGSECLSFGEYDEKWSVSCQVNTNEFWEIYSEDQRNLLSLVYSRANFFFQSDDIENTIKDCTGILYNRLDTGLFSSSKQTKKAPTIIIIVRTNAINGFIKEIIENIERNKKRIGVHFLSSNPKHIPEKEADSMIYVSNFSNLNNKLMDEEFKVDNLDTIMFADLISDQSAFLECMDNIGHMLGNIERNQKSIQLINITPHQVIDKDDVYECFNEYQCVSSASILIKANQPKTSFFKVYKDSKQDIPCFIKGIIHVFGQAKRGIIIYCSDSVFPEAASGFNYIDRKQRNDYNIRKVECFGNGDTPSLLVVNNLSLLEKITEKIDMLIIYQNEQQIESCLSLFKYNTDISFFCISDDKCDSVGKIEKKLGFCFWSPNLCHFNDFWKIKKLKRFIVALLIKNTPVDRFLIKKLKKKFPADYFNIILHSLVSFTEFNKSLVKWECYDPPADPKIFIDYSTNLSIERLRNLLKETGYAKYITINKKAEEDKLYKYSIWTDSQYTNKKVRNRLSTIFRSS